MPELLTMKQIAKRFQVHKATIYRWIKANEFPKPAVKKRGMEKAITEIENDGELGFSNRVRLIEAIRAAMPKTEGER